MSKPNLRADAALVVHAVLEQGQSMASALPQAQQHYHDGRDKGLLAEICYGIMRTLPQLEVQLRRQLSAPLNGKKRRIQCLLLVGLYQLKHTRVQSHAAISETVEACRKLKAPGMTGFVNGVLRALLRNLDALKQEQFEAAPVQWAHPNWLLKRLQHAYPEHWQQIAAVNNQAPPLWLRNNRRHQSREQYLARLSQAGIEAIAGASADAIRLPVAQDVRLLSGFEQGDVSVQDLSAQYSAELLACQAGDAVLDVCSAPGGKTCHLLESQPQIGSMLAIDLYQERLDRVQQNLERLQLSATLRQGDGRYPEQWAPGQQFDRILLDAPCSATGVIRRNPDSKWLRRDADIAQLVQIQAEILAANWQILKPGGTLLYATCSVLPEENCEQVKAFLQQNDDAMLSPIHPQDNALQPGWQLLPQSEGGDGFYYARLIKRS